LREREFVRSVLGGLRPRKRWGQHFLVNEAVADRIVESSGVSSSDVVLEIGAGLGVLTERLSPRARRVLAVEVDERLCDILAERVSTEDVFLLRSDVLALDLSLLASNLGIRAFKVVSNLPYSVATQIIFWLIENRRWVVDALLMVQREVAERLTAQPGTKAYGAMTLKVGYRAGLEVLYGVGRRDFLPEPKVDSTVIRMELREQPASPAADEDHLFKLVDASFRTRRKMLRNCLRSDFGLDNRGLGRLESAAGLDLRRRGETLTLEEFVRLSDEIERIAQEE
jgi:16S rRNA (adenine1518-N6/adenine1519-N6)-dimethyltransferase